MTNRGKWLILVGLAVAALGMLTGRIVVGLWGLMLILWIAFEWIVFAIRVRAVVRGMRLERSLVGQPAGTVTLWAGQPFTIRVRLRPASRLGLAYVLATDRVPPALECVEGAGRAEGPISRRRPLELTYRLRSDAPGLARFEGVRLDLADLQGLFYARAFVRQTDVYTILPALMKPPHTTPQWKRYNLLPPPGVHRHLRPGVGSDLLEIRAYVPGDSPRTIAWKVSARRGELMSKDFESEVPVRCTLFLDASNSVRVGPPGRTALTRMAQLAAVLVQSAAGNRDPVGLCVFDDRGSEFLTPSGSHSQVVRILNRLAEVAGRRPEAVQCPFTEPLAAADAFCSEVYPDLMARSVNWTPIRWSLSRRKRLAARRRKQVAAVVAACLDLSPGALGMLLEDDQLFSEITQRFLAQHRVPFVQSFYDERGRYRFRSSGKVEVLANALMRAAAKGHDTELFVLLADLLELTDRFEPLAGTIQMALARHHRVIVLCPWPVSIPLPCRGCEPDQDAAPIDAPLRFDPDRLDETIAELDTRRFHRAFRDLRRRLAPLRVPVICAGESESAHLVLARMDRLRAGRRVP